MSIGIIPAGGKATRMGGIPKMLLPTPRGPLFQVLCDRMRRAGAEGLLVDASTATYPILAPFCAHDTVLYVAGQPTMCASVLDALPRSVSDTFLFGMPDTYFEDDAAFVKLAAALDNGADVAVGLFHTRPEQRHKLGMVETDGDKVVWVVDKSPVTDLEWAWGVLAWRPAFWDCLEAREPHVGYGLPRAIVAGLDVRAVYLDGGYWDCGTGPEYFDLIRYLTAERMPV